VSSSVNIIAPPVSLADVRGSQAANKLKDANSAVDSEKIKKSAREFEAVLLSHWLEQAEQSFATVPGAEKDQDAIPGHDQFQAIAVQAIATSLSGKNGGLGIASLVTKHLEIAAAHRQHCKTLILNGFSQPSEPTTTSTEGIKKLNIPLKFLGKSADKVGTR